MAETVTSSTVELPESRRCGRCRRALPGDPLPITGSGLDAAAESAP